MNEFRSLHITLVFSKRMQENYGHERPQGWLSFRRGDGPDGEWYNTLRIGRLWIVFGIGLSE